MKIHNYLDLKDIAVNNVRDSIKKNAYSFIRGLFDENDIKIIDIKKNLLILT